MNNHVNIGYSLRILLQQLRKNVHNCLVDYRSATSIRPLKYLYVKSIAKVTCADQISCMMYDSECMKNFTLNKYHVSKSKRKVKEAYLYSAYYKQLICRCSGMAHVTRNHSFTCQPHVYPHVEWTIPAFNPSCSVTALWLVLISRPAESRRLSWPRVVGPIYHRNL